jgi:acetyltransferase-like isoleucine patch superfamily enzyme
MLSQAISKTLSYIILRLKTFNKGLLIGSSLKLKYNTRIKKMSREGVIQIASNVSVGYNTEFYVWGGKMSIGNNTSFNDNCKIYENIRIGQFCLFASNIFVSSGSHIFSHRNTLPIKVQDQLITIDKPVIIEDDCWIGFGVVILPGIYVGKGAVLGSNSVISKDVFPYTVAGGIPAKEISKRFDFISNASRSLSSTNSNHWPYFYRGIDYNCFKDPGVLSSGIGISENLAIFFLCKSAPVNSLKISGVNFEASDFSIALNEKLIEVVKIQEGDFKIDLTIPSTVNQSEDIQSTGIPASLQDQFVVCSILVKAHRNKTKEIKWKVKEVEIL